MEVGDVIRIDDRLTGFDLNKIARPYCVVRVIGDPWAEIYVVPRSTDRVPGGVETPAGVLPGINKRGWFVFRAYRLTPSDIPGIEPVGQLEDAISTRVVDLANVVEIDID